MALIVVAGLVDDEIFQHVALIAEHLSTVLPNFSVRKISKRKEKWEKWLKKESSKRGWHYTKSPIVWKELSMAGGHAVLLGGASGFWEYLKEYYDVMSYFNKEQKSKILLDKLQIFAQEEELQKSDLQVRRVCIVGAGHPMTSLLLMELLRVPELSLKDGVVITLCDAVEFFEILKNLTRDVTAMRASPGLACVRVQGDLKHAVTNCDLCIILLHTDSERNGRDLLPWLYYNFYKMVYIADALKARAPHKCRVILAAVGEVPLCFNAHVIADIAKNLSVRNIVTVAADLALESLETLAREGNIPRHTIGQPPVWGFLGVNKLVDVYKAYHVVEVFRPDADNTKIYPSGSTLKPGTRTVEVRNMSYLLHKSKGLYLKILHRKLQAEELLKRSTYIVKVKATVDLVRHWYSESSVCLSLGICSNGSFGLPHGMYFSQPARLIDGKWKPYSCYPLPDDINCRLIDLVILPMHILKYFSLGERSNAIWLLNVKSSDLKKQSSDIRHSMLVSLRHQLKAMASQQQLLAQTTGNKITELKEQHTKMMVEQIRAKRFETLKKKKLTLLKESRNKDKEEKIDKETEEETGESNIEEEEVILSITQPEDEDVKENYNDDNVNKSD